jgi:fatty acid desaturase
MESNASAQQLTSCPVCQRQDHQCPRCQAYERLPKWAWLQAFITSVMGVPHVGQQPYFRHHSPFTAAIMVFLMLALSVLSSTLLIALIPQSGPTMRVLLTLMLLASLMLTSGLLRAMSMFILHYASHGAFGRFNDMIGDFAAMVGFTVPLTTYRRDHNIHHPLVATEKDPDQSFIEQIITALGQTVEAYERELLYTLLPGAKFLREQQGRRQSNFGSEQPLRRKLTLATILALPVVIAVTVSLIICSLMPLIVWLVAWALPLTYGVWVSKVLYALGLHVYFYQPDPQLSARENYQLKTGARFFGDEVPAIELPLLRRYTAWVYYFLRFVLVHLLIGKAFVMGFSDNQQHDAHHVNGREFKFWVAPYSRHEMAMSGKYQMWHTFGSVMTPIRENSDYWSKLSK